MRRYDLDWLRVLVFALLIFFHVGMFFVPWDFHIKNNVIYHWLIWPMLLLNQWRLHLLFIISGMGTYYALSKRTGLQFTGERVKRLFIPLIIGMAFIVPPQVYFERLANGQFSGSYFEFWPMEAFIGSYPTGNISWHHLWFIVYLLVYSILLVPVFLYLRKHTENNFMKWVKKLVASRHAIYVFILPLFFYEAFLNPIFPSTHALIDDWYTFFKFLTLFCYGFLLISVKDSFWATAQKHRRLYLIYALVFFSVFAGFIIFPQKSTSLYMIFSMIKALNLWSWILAIFGYAATYLNRNTKFLAYGNEAVYPFYILHQTVIIIVGYYVMNLNWNFFLKASIMVLATFAVCFIIYEFLIRRISFLRPLFGMKTNKVRYKEPEARKVAVQV